MEKKPIDLSGWRGIVTKLIIVVAIMAVACGISLKLIERAKDPLRQGIEQYLSQISGQHVGIDELSYASFLPDIDFRMKNVIFRAPEDDQGISARIEKLAFAMPFWSMMTGRTTLRALYLSEVHAKEGLWTPYALSITTLEIIDDESAPPALQADGRYDGGKMSLSLALSAKGKRGENRTFYLSPGAAVSLTLGRAHLTGAYTANSGAAVLENAYLSGDGKSYGPRNIVLKNDGSPQGDVLSCLLAQRASKPVNDNHPCVAFFKG